MKPTGWIKSYRSVLTHDLLANDNNSFIVFMKLLHSVDKKTGRLITGRFKVAELTNLKPTTAYQALKRLENAKMVTLESNNKYTVIYICNWKKFQSTDDSTHDNQMTTRRQPDDNEMTLNKNKEVRIKNSTTYYGKPEINEMFEYWQTTTGLAITAKVQANRRACSNLINKHGVEKVQQLINGVAAAQADQYAPRISDFTQLQLKLNELLVWGKQRNKKKGVKIS